MTAVLVLVAACQTSGSGRQQAAGSHGAFDGRAPISPPSSSATGETSAAGCGSHPGAETDLAAEPKYSATYLHRWTNRDGCPVRLDVLMLRGPGGCGPMDILMGTPLGQPAQMTTARFYEQNDSLGFKLRASIPPEAMDTGYVMGGATLWTVEGSDRFIYLRYTDRTERWPRNLSPTVCQ
jgi:hypothetical protein